MTKFIKVDESDLPTWLQSTKSTCSKMLNQIIRFGEGSPVNVWALSFIKCFIETYEPVNELEYE